MTVLDPQLLERARAAADLARQQRARLDEIGDELDECRAFLADRERQRRPAVSPQRGNVIPFPIRSP